ncbi:MAG: type II 3-dehydroquinate dehydratase [Weeksellaceae bacterium]
MLQIQIINGPNLNLLGKREPEIYGTQTFEDFFEELRSEFPEVELHYFQSNHEGDLIDKLHQSGFSYHGIIINPGAYAHYSYAIADAIKAISSPVIEVHISDISQREAFRKNLITGENCQKIISGKGLEGYRMAVKEFIKA